MTTTTTLFDRLSPLVLACVTTLILMGGGSPLHAQTVVVMVNGQPITNYDVEQRTKLDFLSTHKPAPRQQVIEELID
jgi:peptidyl-prolyl cis-trans isomerase SurA